MRLCATSYTSHHPKAGKHLIDLPCVSCSYNPQAQNTFVIKRSSHNEVTSSLVLIQSLNQRHTIIITHTLLHHIIRTPSHLPPTTRSSTSTSTTTTTSTPRPTKPKAPNPPSQRITHSINRTLRTPQTNLTLAVRNIEQLDRSARPQAIAPAIVLRVLCKDKAPKHGHVPAEGEGGPCEGLEADGWDWV